MNSVIDDLKHRARLMQRFAAKSHPEVIAELCVLDEFALASPGEIAASVTRRHCMAAIAKQLGFDGWPHLLTVLEGARLVDFGKLLVPRTSSAFWNVWVSDYDEAAKIRAEHGGYLLAYGMQYFIADENFVSHLGLDPDDPDWDLIGRDWPNAACPEARTRLYAQLIRHKLPRLAAGKEIA